MIKYRRKMLCFNPWDHQNFKKINASYQTGPFLKVSVSDFLTI